MFERDPIRRLVVRLPNWVGDVVMATPALRAIREHWPEAEITAMCLPSGEQILRGSPRIDRFEVYRRNGPDGGLFGRGRMIRRLRERDYDLGVLLPNSLSSAWLFWRGRVRRRLGTDYGKRGLLLTDRFRPEMDGNYRVPKPMAEHYADLLETVGVPRGPTAYELFETERGRRRADETLTLLGVGEDDPLVAINPGASFGPSKRWPPERFAEVADRLQRERGLKPLLIGGPGEEALLHEVAGRMKTEALSTADELLDLDALKSVIRRATLLVTTDTGPRHYAPAFDVPAVVVMGSTDPRYTALNLERTVVLRREDLECSPCHQKTCPLTHHRCMTWIAADEVCDACERLLGPA